MKTTHQPLIDDDASPIYLWEDAVSRYLEETAHKKTHYQDITKFKWLAPFMNGRPLNQMSRDFIESVLEHKKNVKGATLNRLIALIRCVLRKAKFEWEWVVKVPFFRMRPEPKQRVRWITHEEAKRLLACLPKDLADAAAFSLATGIRKSNCFFLEWSQVDLDNRIALIYADQAKAQKDIVIPLNKTAFAILERRQGIHPTRVFTSRGKPIKTYNARVWKRCLKQAGIENFRWHDIRRYVELVIMSS